MIFSILSGKKVNFSVFIFFGMCSIKYIPSIPVGIYIDSTVLWATKPGYYLELRPEDNDIKAATSSNISPAQCNLFFSIDRTPDCGGENRVSKKRVF